MSSKGHKRSASVDISSIHHPHLPKSFDFGISPTSRRQSITKVSYDIVNFYQGLLNINKSKFTTSFLHDYSILF